ncbi:MAG: GtrA family protein [Lachnospiraceae bacterium]|nr:GtrA family protein [Lachnospiraceae bacterium]
MSKIIDGFWWLVEVVAGWCLGVLFKILHKELTPEVKENFLQFVRFLVVGVSNTVISYLLLTGSRLLLEYVGVAERPAYIIANAIAFILGVGWSYFWNNKYVFKKGEGESRSFFKSLIKTYISYSFTGLFLSSILLVVWIEWLGISKFVAPLINSIIGVPINFLINKFWSFKSEER